MLSVSNDCPMTSVVRGRDFNARERLAEDGRPLALSSVQLPDDLENAVTVMDCAAEENQQPGACEQRA